MIVNHVPSAEAEPGEKPTTPAIDNGHRENRERQEPRPLDKNQAAKGPQPIEVNVGCTGGKETYAARLKNSTTPVQKTKTPNPPPQQMIVEEPKPQKKPKKTSVISLNDVRQAKPSHLRAWTAGKLYQAVKKLGSEGLLTQTQLALSKATFANYAKVGYEARDLWARYNASDKSVLGHKCAHKDCKLCALKMSLLKIKKQAQECQIYQASCQSKLAETVINTYVPTTTMTQKGDLDGTWLNLKGLKPVQIKDRIVFQRYGMSSNDKRKANEQSRQYLQTGEAPSGTPNMVFIEGEKLNVGPAHAPKPVNRPRRQITKKNPAKVCVPPAKKPEYKKPEPVRKELTEEARRELHEKLQAARLARNELAKEKFLARKASVFVPLPTEVSRLQSHRHTARFFAVEQPKTFTGPITFGFTAKHLLPNSKTQMYPDILQFGEKPKVLAAVTGECYLGKPKNAGGERIEVKGTIIMVPTKNNKLRDYICVPSFYHNNNAIPSGTPIYNSKGMLCSVITQSDAKGTYAISTDKRYRTSDKTPYCVTEHSDYAEVTQEGVGTFIAKGNKVDGRYDGIPMHCVPLANRPHYKKTHHHYIDYFSRELFAPITKEVHIGSSDGKQAIVIEDKILAYGYDYKQLHIAALPYINSNEILMSGTPIYNTKGEICSAITSSVGNRYVLTCFGDNDTVTIQGASIKENVRAKRIVYGAYEFDDKNELIEYMRSPKSDGKQINIWHGTPSSINVSVNGTEIYRKRYTGIMANKFNSQNNTRRMVNATIETSRVKSEIDALATRMSALSAVATAASNSTNSVMRTGGVVQTPRRNRKKKSRKPKTIIEKVTTAVTNSISIAICLFFLLPIVQSAVPKPSSYYCKGMGCPLKFDYGEKPAWVICKKETPVTFTEGLAKAYCGDKKAQDEYNTYAAGYTCNEALEEQLPLSTLSVKDVKEKLVAQYKEVCDPLVGFKEGLVYENMTCCKGVVNLQSVTKANRALIEEELLLRPTLLSYADRKRINAVFACMEEDENFNITQCLDKHFNKLPSCEKPEGHHNPLKGINGADCTKGVEMPSDVKSCSDASPCYNEPAKGCMLGSKKLSYGTGALTTPSATGDNVCCSLDCFSASQLLALLEDQPKCTSCIYPLKNILWKNCEEINIKPKQLHSLEVWANGTEFTYISGNNYWCSNGPALKLCCDGRGPAATHEKNIYFDGVCACVPAKKIANKLNVQFDKWNSLLNDWWYSIAILLLAVAVLPAKLVVLLLAVYIAITNVMAECSVDNMITPPDTFKANDMPYKAKLWKGTCIDLGSKTVQLEKVNIIAKYTFKYQIPLSIKNTCTDFDWGCKGGLGDSIFDTTPCANCNGLHIKLTDFETSFPSSGCFIGNQIATRIDTCFNMGDSKSLVYVYSRLESKPVIKVVVNEFIANGTNLAVESKDLSDVSVAEDYWPQLIAILPGSSLCAYDTVDFSKVCKYPKKEKNATWSSDCIDIRKQWNTKDKKYGIQFTNAGFSNQLISYFETCTLKTLALEDEYLEVEQNVDSLVATINTVTLKANISDCAELPMYSIRKGVSGWHKSTIVEFEKGAATCSVFVHIDGCESLNGCMHVISQTYNTSKTFWCAARSKGEVSIKGKKTWSSTEEVVKNYVPAINDIWQSVDKIAQTAKTVSSMKGMLDLITDIDFGYIPRMFDGFLDRGLFRIVTCAILAYLSWSAFLAMKWILAAIIISIAVIVWNVQLAEALNTDEIVDVTEQAIEAAVEVTNNLGYKVLSLYLITISKLRLVNIILELLRLIVICLLVTFLGTKGFFVVALIVLVRRLYKSYSCGSGCFSDVSTIWPMLPVARYLAGKLHNRPCDETVSELEAYAKLVTPANVLKIITKRVGSSVGYANAHINCSHVVGVAPTEGYLDLITDLSIEYATETSTSGIVVNYHTACPVKLMPCKLFGRNNFYVINGKRLVSGSILYVNGRVAGLVIGKIKDYAVVETVHPVSGQELELPYADFVFTVTSEDELEPEELSRHFRGGRMHYADWLRILNNPEVTMEELMGWFDAVEKLRRLNRMEPLDETVTEFVKMVKGCKDRVVDATSGDLHGHETIEKQTLNSALKSIDFTLREGQTGAATIPPQYLIATNNPLVTAECPVVIHLLKGDEYKVRLDDRHIFVECQDRTEVETIQAVISKLVRFGVRLIGVRTPKRDTTLALQLKLSIDVAFGTCVVWYNDYKIAQKAMESHYELNGMPIITKIPDRPWLSCWGELVEGFVATGVTLNAIKAWDKVPSAETTHSIINTTLITTNGTVVMDLDDEPTFKNKIAFLRLETAVGSGAGFVYQNSLVTSYHVTRGNPVELRTPRGRFISGKPSFVDKDRDVIMYGEVLAFPSVDAGEIVAMIDPLAKRAQMYIVGGSGSKMRGRVSDFHKLKPIKIVSKSTYQLDRGTGYNGSSGSPIIDSKGRPLAIYGLMKWHSEEDMPAQLNCMIPSDLKDHDVGDFFKAAAVEVAKLSTDENKLPNDATHMLLVAPTGTGKTTTLTLEIARLLKHSKILLLQPTTTAVRNAYVRIGQMIGQQKIDKVRVTYLIGNRNADATGSCPDVRELARPTTEIKIMTYGKAMVQDTSGYSLYLLDEVHTVNDVDVVAMQLLIGSSQPTNRIVKLTATPVSVNGAHHLMDGKSIATTKYDIDTTYKVEPLCERSAKDNNMVCIPRQVLGSIGQGCSISKPILMKGVVVFFVASVKDTESGANWARKYLGPDSGINVFSCYSGSKQVTDYGTNAWIFATDVIGQSVTIPGLSVVVDFMYEYKPKVTLTKDTDGIHYSKEIVKQVISVATQQQRKGRVGRTNHGFYVCPDLTPSPNVVVDPSIIPALTLKLIGLKKSTTQLYDTLIDTDYGPVVEQMKEINWLEPSYLNSDKWYTEWWKHVTKQGVNQPIRPGLSDKLQHLINADCDSVWWYLTPIYPATNRERALDEPSKYGKGEDSTQSIAFYHTISSYCGKVSDDRQYLTVTSGRLDSCMEVVDKDEPNMPTLIAPKTDIMEVEDYSEDEEEYHNMALNIVGGISVAVASLAAISTYIDRKSTRVVTEYIVMEEIEAAMYAKYLTCEEAKVANKEAVGKLRFIMLRVREYIYKNYRALASTLGYGEEQHSTFLTGAMAAFVGVWEKALMIMTTHGGTAVWATGGLGTIYGMLVPTLEAALGPAWAAVTTGILSAVVFFHMGAGVLSVALVSGLVGFVIKYIVSEQTDSMGGRVKKTGAATITRSLVSSGLGAMLALTLQSHTLRAATVTPTTTALGQLMVVGSSSATSQAYQLYCVFIEGDASTAQIAQLVLSLFSTTPTSAAISASIVLCAVLLRVILKNIVKNYAEKVKPSPKDHFNPANDQYEQMIAVFDSIVRNTLAVGALLTNPLSLLSTIIRIITHVCAGEELGRELIASSIRKTAGVNPVIEFIQSLAGLLIVEEQHSAVGWLVGVSSILSMGASGMYIQQNQHALRTCKTITCIQAFFTALYNQIVRVLNWIYNKTASGVKHVGRLMGRGAIDGLRESIGLTASEQIDCIVLNELPPVVVTNDLVLSFLNKKRETKGLTAIDCLMLEVNVASANASGDMRSEFITSVAEVFRTDGVHGKMTLMSEVPIELTKASTHNVYETLRNYFGTLELKNDILTSVQKTAVGVVTVETQLAYTEEKTRCAIRVITTTMKGMVSRHINLMLSVLPVKGGIEVACIGNTVSDSIFFIFSNLLTKILDDVKRVDYNAANEPRHFGDILSPASLQQRNSIVANAIEMIMKSLSSNLEASTERLDRKTFIRKPNNISTDYWMMHHRTIMKQFTQEVELPMLVEDPGLNLPTGVEIKGFNYDCEVEKSVKFESLVYVVDEILVKIQNTQNIDVLCNQVANFALRVGIISTVGKVGSNSRLIYYVPSSCGCTLHFSVEDNADGFDKYFTLNQKCGAHTEMHFKSLVNVGNTKELPIRTVTQEEVEQIKSYMTQAKKMSFKLPGKTTATRVWNSVKSMLNRDDSPEEQHQLSWWRLFTIDEQETKPLVVAKTQTQWLERVNRWVLLACCIPENPEPADYEDADDMQETLEYYIDGFEKARVKKGVHFNYIATGSVTAPPVPVNPESTLAKFTANNRKGNRLSHSQWEDIKVKHRVELPKRLNLSNEEYKYRTSRGGCKMQQLVEQDREFFEDCQCILDPTSGFGGFANYLAYAFRDNKPKEIYVSTLMEKKHAVPDMSHIAVKDSNVRIVSLLNCKGIGHANIQDEKTLQVIAETVAESHDGIDLLILDAGEFFTTSQKNMHWWQSKEGLSYSKLEAYMQLTSMLKPGGKLLMKFNGYFAGGEEVFNQICQRFKHVKVFKPGTSHHYNPEFYVYLKGYDKKRTVNNNSLRYLYQRVGVHVDNAQTLGARILISRGRGWSSTKRHDWYDPTQVGVVYMPVTNLDRHSGFRVKYTTAQGKHVDTNWSMNYGNKVRAVAREIQKRTGKKMLPIAKCHFENLEVVGKYKSSEENHHRRKATNALMSEGTHKVFGLNNDNATYGCTQYTTEFREKAIKKRLDVDPGRLSPIVLKELSDIADIMYTERGRAVLNSMGYMTKEEVLVAINAKGATGKFDQQHNLKAFVEAHEDWYELVMEHRVRHYEMGTECPSYNTVRFKAESKVKKNVVEGRLIYNDKSTREELQKENDLVPRFIMFGDAMTRIAHYIVVGKVLELANKEKLYKGTMSGTPVHRQGHVLRAIWDMHFDDNRREIKNGYNAVYDVDVVQKRAIGDERSPVGVTMDYSGLDGTITAEERFVEARFITSFYKPEHKQTVMNCMRDMCYAVCVNDAGDVWLRPGQRGSGELVTSFGNTFLVQCNTVRAMAKSLGAQPADILEQAGTVSVGKILEVGAVPTFSDGDDTVIITSAENARRISNNIGQYLEEANKSIRSGTKSGVEVCRNFESLTFCSHKYTRVRVGKDALLRDDYSRIYYLPTKPLADILSKIRLTLKMSSTVHDWAKDEKGGSREVTRSRALSYLLLYPHIRPVRYFCLAVLAILGDGVKCMDRYERRFPGVDFGDCPTIMTALMSLYGVTTLNDMAYRDYKEDAKDIRVLRQNVRSTNDYCELTMKSLAASMFNWMHDYEVQYVQALSYDSRLSAYYVRWTEYFLKNDKRASPLYVVTATRLRCSIKPEYLPRMVETLA